MNPTRWLLVVICAASSGSLVVAQSTVELHTATLYSAQVSEKCSEPCQLNLINGERFGISEGRPGGSDLIYGQLRLGDPGPYQKYQWLSLGVHAGDHRTVFRDLGAIEWPDVNLLPALCPRPKLNPGETRTVTVNASAGATELSPEGFIVPAVEGHIYELRIRYDDVDQYALVRVEEFGDFETCKLSWRLVDGPDTSTVCSAE